MGWPDPARPLRHGVVVDFDEAAGLGRVESGGERYPFHCTAVADGSRTIAVGTPVVFTLAARHAGRVEASSLTPR